jgi:Phosphomannose isomerase type I
VLFGRAFVGSGLPRPDRLPLLVKLLDPAEWLSVQVHPDDDLARHLAGPRAAGKTEASLAPERGPGRPPSRYETNPAIFLKAWTKRPELVRSTEQDDVLSILSVDSERFETAAPEPEGATREPGLGHPGPVAPHEPAELGDWLAAPLWEPDGPGSDEWEAI